MLTRLKVSGFKNLVDVDVYFGPFTCIAGANGAGKSNLFDAIHFLSALADHTLVEAAHSVRAEGGRSSDIRSLFHRAGQTYSDEISLEADMIVPLSAFDDLGQEAQAGNTFLRYGLTLGYRGDNGHRSSDTLEVRREELKPIDPADTEASLPFPHSDTWQQSAVREKDASPFISTEQDSNQIVIKLHNEGGHGIPVVRSAANLPRTVLSATNAAESPTVLLARREMQSWRLLQLEPSALRQPDDFKAPSNLGIDGSHLPATLARLAQTSGSGNGAEGAGDSAQVYAQLANRLAELVVDVGDVSIDEDQKRELFTLIVSDRRKTPHPARSLSDGTLRFLAMAVIELDTNARGLLCLEEPENGIHPERIPAMLDLLQAIAVDPKEPVGPDNPLRQVIVNTHSPAVVGQVPPDSLLIAERRETVEGTRRFMRAAFSYLSGTWREKVSGSKGVVAGGKLLAYLNPILPPQTEEGQTDESGVAYERVADRPDLQPDVFTGYESPKIPPRSVTKNR